MPRERSDHESRLPSDDLRQAIEEVYQPIEQGSRPGRESRIRDCIVPPRYVIYVHI
jgi:hypothetical protein